MKDTQKSYVGDGVYAVFKGGQLVLTTENGVKATNTIILEPEVWSALVTYVSDCISGGHARDDES